MNDKVGHPCGSRGPTRERAHRVRRRAGGQGTHTPDPGVTGTPLLLPHPSLCLTTKRPPLGLEDRTPIPVDEGSGGLNSFPSSSRFSCLRVHPVIGEETNPFRDGERTGTRGPSTRKIWKTSLNPRSGGTRSQSSRGGNCTLATSGEKSPGVLSLRLDYPSDEPRPVEVSTPGF